ncbi:hypothetical protein ANN_22186 [Periplaneta americana]|uniref:Uncharacterized protein n=1 Tax=Periplaneta americana TaxID=6978 RepID=A0ABQ8S8E4_PERAM|nr:hypothetical protein ANN_22186 [Periplaneta americana]
MYMICSLLLQVQMSIAFFTLSGLFSAVVLSYGIEVIENVNESDEENSQGSSSTVVNNDQNNETSVSSTNNNETTYKNNWSSAPQPEDMHRIITPVVITTPHGDKQKNFTASPMLDAIYNPEYHQFNHEHYQKTAQKHKSHDSGYHSSKEEDDDGQKKHHYSQPLLPDMFLTQQYLKAQQQKEQDEYKSKNNNQNVLKPAIPQAKSNAFNFNSDAISYKPLKFDSDFPSTLFTSDKGGSSAEFGNNDKKQVPFHYTLPSPIKSNTHPYPYQNPYSSSEKDLEPPTTTSSMAKQYHPGSWADGYKTGINYQEGEKTSMWKKVLNMLAAFIPLGLFLAALPPNVLTINTTQ